MKLSRKNLFAIILAGSLMFSTACAQATPQTSSNEQAASSASAAESTSQTSDPSSKDVEIRFTWWGDTKRHEVYNAICDDFESVNPGIKVVREPTTFNDYRDKLVAQLAGGGAPDVMGIHANFGSDFAARGVLEDMQPYIDSGVFETEFIPAEVLEGGRINGLLCMVAQGVTFDAMCINHSLIEEIGADIGVDYMNGEEFTWESFANAHKIFREAALAAGKDLYFASLPQEDIQVSRYWVRNTEPGADVYKEGGGLGTSQQTITNWFAYNQALRAAGYAPDAAAITEDRSLALEEKMYTTGKTAVGFIPANQLRLYTLQMPESQLVLMPYPNGNDGTRVNSIIASHIAVYSKGDEAHREAGMRFINHFVNRESATNILQMEQGVPPNTKCAEALIPVLDAPSAAALKFVDTTMGKDAKGFVYNPPGAAEFSVAYKDAADRVAYGEQGPEESTTQLFGEAEAIFARQ